MKTYFFGWTNIKNLIRELDKIYSSSEKSYYSKKRIESGVAFIILQWGMVHWMVLNVNKMSAEQLFIWATIEGVVCGYTLNKIEKEKIENAK